MTTRRVWRSICLAIGLAASQHVLAAGESASLPYDHYNPVVLNQKAVERIRQGDLSTATILLERAHLLAPYETRIERNLRTLRLLQTEGQKPYRLLILPATVEGMQAQPEAATSGGNAEHDMLPSYPLWEIK